MATITLTGSTIGCCLGSGTFESIGSAFSSAKKSTETLSQALNSLKGKLESAMAAVNVDTSHEQAQTAEKREETKQTALTTGYDKLETLVADVSTIDNKSADKIRERKDDFYARYSWLKPDCEKTDKELRDEKWAARWQSTKEWLEKAGEVLKNIGKWCTEHWESICKILAAVVIIACLGILTALTGGVAAVIFAAAFHGAIVGAIVGAAVGAAEGAVEYYNENGTLKGASGYIFDSAASGTLTGTFTGAVSGALQGVTQIIGSAMSVTKIISGHKGLARIANMTLGGISQISKGVSTKAINCLFDGDFNVYTGDPSKFTEDLGWDILTSFLAGFAGGFKTKYDFHINQILYSGDKTMLNVKWHMDVLESTNIKSILWESTKSGTKKVINSVTEGLWKFKVPFNWKDVVNIVFEPTVVY
jgi:hypothetical protein